MGRHRIISDDEVLRVAREHFRAHGHTATTRQIADDAGISEAVLYQRFVNKKGLFFASMMPRGPDIELLLGPTEPTGDAHAYVRGVVTRLGKYFSEVIPLALRVMTHPSPDTEAVERTAPAGPVSIREGLAARLASLARRKLIKVRSTAATAKLLSSLAHDWALGIALSHGKPVRGVRDLTDMVDIVWNGLQPR
jgi:AcrR family transcriptional regulator